MASSVREIGAVLLKRILVPCCYIFIEEPKWVLFFLLVVKEDLLASVNLVEHF